LASVEGAGLSSGMGAGSVCVWLVAAGAGFGAIAGTASGSGSGSEGRKETVKASFDGCCAGALSSSGAAALTRDAVCTGAWCCGDGRSATPEACTGAAGELRGIEGDGGVKGTTGADLGNRDRVGSSTVAAGLATDGWPDVG
jgi:hypothetical protein